MQRSESDNYERQARSLISDLNRTNPPPFDGGFFIGAGMTEEERHVLVRLLQEKTGLIAAGNMAIRAALELMQQRGYVITPPKPKED